jgi:hypothetical protein
MSYVGSSFVIAFGEVTSLRFISIQIESFLQFNGFFITLIGLDNMVEKYFLTGFVLLYTKWIILYQVYE